MLLDMQADMPSRRPALAAAKLNRYSIDIAALSETRLADEGSLTEVGEGYTFFWKVFRNHLPAFTVLVSRYAPHCCVEYLRHQ